MKENLTRRDFVKVAGVTAGTIALSAAANIAAPMTALADEGSQKVSANLYVLRADHNMPLVTKDAYLTNANNPLKLQGFPTTPVSGNADLVDNGDGTYEVSIPVVNELFSLTDLASGSNCVVKSTERVSNSYLPASASPNSGATQRISRVVVTLTEKTSDGEYVFGYAGDKENGYTYNGTEEYAAHPLVQDYRFWPIHLVVDFSGVN